MKWYLKPSMSHSKLEYVSSYSMKGNFFLTYFSNPKNQAYLQQKVLPKSVLQVDLDRT